MLYKTRYGEAITRILSRYGHSESCVGALEILIQTVQAQVKTDSNAEMATKTCRGLHLDKPGRGVVCAKCFDAAFERGAREKALTGDERAGMKRAVPAGLQGGEGSAGSDDPEAAKINEAELEADVMKLIGEAGMEKG